MDVKVKMVVNEDETKVIKGTGKLVNGERTCVGGWFMQFTDFKEKELSFGVVLEIMNIYNENDQIIVENEWEKHGVIIEE